MLLAIDIGNTNIVAGVFATGTLVATWRLATNRERMPDEYAVELDGLFRLSGLDPVQLRGAIICSVVPRVQAALREAVRRYLHIDPLIVTPGLDLGLQVRYSPPTAVGADRLVNAVAVLERYSVPAIVVDFGTATTFDAIARDGAYIGGAIAPGLEVSTEALVARTAQLPSVPLEPPPSAIGTSTITSLQSGALFGYAGLVDGLVDRFRSELGDDACVIATGGLATVISPYTRTVQNVAPDLTLIGLYLTQQRLMTHADR